MGVSLERAAGALAPSSSAVGGAAQENRFNVDAIVVKQAPVVVQSSHRTAPSSLVASPHGHLLVGDGRSRLQCSSARRFFEVTPDSEIVWEYETGSSFPWTRNRPLCRRLIRPISDGVGSFNGFRRPRGRRSTPPSTGRG